jgi:hypothetical protein
MFFGHRKKNDFFFLIRVFGLCKVTSQSILGSGRRSPLDKAKRCGHCDKSSAFGHDDPILQLQGSSDALLSHDPASFCVWGERRR